jgi:hypothetical protein
MAYMEHYPLLSRFILKTIHTSSQEESKQKQIYYTYKGRRKYGHGGKDGSYVLITQGMLKVHNCETSWHFILRRLRTMY